MRKTLQQLADEAGISLTAASLVLNNKNVRISAEKRDKVLSLAALYNYKPNKIAQGLATKKTRTVGLLVPDIANSFFAESAKYIEANLAQKGYSIILCNTNDKADKQTHYIDLLVSRDVDALIICLAQESLLNNTYISDINSLDVPCVAFDRWGNDMPCSTISVDNVNGAEMAVDYLVERGHTKIGCITGNLLGNSALDRLKGYKNVLKKNNIAIDESIICEGDYTFESGYLNGKKLIEQGVTAIFCCNDQMAYGVYKIVKELNLKVPQQLSIIGFDDLFFSAMTEVPLTTIKQPILDMAAKVNEALFDKLNGLQTEQHFFITPTLIERNSVIKLL